MVMKGRYIETQDGKPATVCACSEISSFMKYHSEIYDKHSLLQKKATLYETIAENIPSGFHRCEAKKGLPFLFTSDHFTEIVGLT